MIEQSTILQCENYNKTNFNATAYDHSVPTQSNVPCNKNVLLSVLRCPVDSQTVSQRAFLLSIQSRKFQKSGSHVRCVWWSYHNTGNYGEKGWMSSLVLLLVPYSAVKEISLARHLPQPGESNSTSKVLQVSKNLACAKTRLSLHKSLIFITYLMAILNTYFTHYWNQ